MAKPRLTLVEQEKILEETVRLLKEPASWTTGRWKCDLYEVDKKTGWVVTDEHGHAKRACDMNNRPLSQYCIEGGLNQATYNVLGKERAIKLGAVGWGTNPETDDSAFDSGSRDMDPAELLGINKLAMELHEERIRDRCEENGESAEDYDGSDAAMILNDSFEYEPDPTVGHTVIVGLVETRLGQVRDELDAREEVHAAKEPVGSV